MAESRPKPFRSIPFVIGGVLIAGWIFLSILSHGLDGMWVPEAWKHGFAYEIDNGLMPTETFAAFHLVATSLLVSLIWLLTKGRCRIGIWWILAVALVCRVAAMFGEPIHENDFYRYLWDGKSSLAGINPYRFEPGALRIWEDNLEDEFSDPVSGVNWKGREFSSDEVSLLEKLKDLRGENPLWHKRIGHQAVTTIYPPVSQFLFAIAALLPGWSAWGLKIIFVGFDLATAWMLFSLLRRFGLPAFWVVLYAWHPLVIKEFANSVHYDSIPVFFSLLALRISTSGGEESSLRKAILIGLAVAAGFLSKYFTVLLLPLFLWWLVRKKVGWRRFLAPELLVGSLVFIVISLLAFLPFVFWNGAGWERVFSGLSTYQAHWQYNPGVFAVMNRAMELAGLTSHFAVAKVVSAILLGGVVWLVSWDRAEDGLALAGKAFVIMAALFVLSPTAFPWYFCWPLAFLVFRPRWSWMLLSALLPMTYLDFQPRAEVPFAFYTVWGFRLLSAWIWIVFFLAWLCETRRRKSR